MVLEKRKSFMQKKWYKKELASCKLEISPAMPSWGKLSTLHYLSFELMS
jgi:hypothetical protein